MLSHTFILDKIKLDTKQGGNKSTNDARQAQAEAEANILIIDRS